MGIATTGSALATGKRLVRFFLSYAHEDQALVDTLLSELRKQYSAARCYEYDVWTDGRIQVGEGWRACIDRALHECDFGLLLVSPAFLGSRFIQEHELPHFVHGLDRPTVKPIIPVGLTKIDPHHHDCRGLQDHQIFLVKERRFFGDLRTAQQKTEFAFELFTRIQERLDAHFASRQRPGPDLDAVLHIPERPPHYEPATGYSFILEELEPVGGPTLGEARDALAELEAWAVKEDAPPFFALLGEYGIGKTTTLKQLTCDFLERRKTGEDLPLPLYVDLRDYVGQARDSVPTIEELLASIIQRSWKLRDRSITSRDVLRLVREEGAVILFDGLDERIVHLSPDRAREFIRTLWAVLPDAARPGDPLPPGKRRGKLLISCRSHYFRDVWSQNAMLVGEDREGMDRGRFPALCLASFSEEQIRRFLAALLGEGVRAEAAFQTIASIHDLADLVRRPYLLKLITEHVDQLQKLRARGEPINGARLYDEMVRKWLLRDHGKHQLEETHKRRLMEVLAAEMWRRETRQWTAEQLEQWLDAYLAADPAMAGAYANKDRTVLKEDLRTATFILRPDVEQKYFRFAHTSIQEYFLASHLAKALADGRPEPWDLPMVSEETLEFLGQILDLQREQSASLQALEAILSSGRPRAALIALRYWLHALRTSRLAPCPERVCLSGADLEDWVIQGPASASLNLRGADLSGARLNRARLEHVDLTGADLTGVEARQALFRRVRAPRANAGGADLGGMVWRGGSLCSANLAGARLSGAHWMGVDLSGTTLPDGWDATAVSRGNHGRTPAGVASTRSVTLVRPVGHAGPVLACAVSPDGRRVLSGANDKTLSIWDAGSGQCLLTLGGHASSIWTCAWSPGGDRAVSGSVDNTLKVWDATTGECQLTLEGHRGAVRGCAWSPDARRILSCSEDRTLRVWDAITGQWLQTLLGHGDSVRVCAWDHGGRRILSCSEDRTLRIWDEASGQCIRTLADHGGAVLACAWSPEDARVASGSGDGTLRIWDAATGECLQVLPDPGSVVLACAWSPDGDRLASVARDHALKIWDVPSGRCLKTLRGHAHSVGTCAWFPDGLRVVSGSHDETLRIWDARSGRCLLILPGHANSPSSWRGQSGFIWSCSWSPRGDCIVSGSFDDTLKIWDTDSGECVLTLPGHSDAVWACAWSPGGDRIASGSEDKTIRIWDVTTGRCLLTLRGHTGSAQACAWSPDGDRLVSGSFDNVLKVWDARSGECLLTLEGHQNAVWACAWSPDGTRIASAAFDGLRIWDAATGRCLHAPEAHQGAGSLHRSSVWTCTWDAAGERVASGSDDGALRIWDAATGQCLRTFQAHEGSVHSCAWSPDGTRIVSGGGDDSLKIWNAVTGECLRALRGHTKAVLTCGWHPTDERIVSGSVDETLRVWDAASGRNLWTGHLFPERQTATIDEVEGRVLHASADAWRWLAWRWIDPATGAARILPLEFFDEEAAGLLSPVLAGALR